MARAIVEIDMPESCAECPLGQSYCKITKKAGNSTKAGRWIGMRLIDADALFRKVKTECNPYGKPTIGFEDGKRVLDWIEHAPTVYRQSGYWTRVHGPDGDGNIVCECSNCHNCDKFALNVEVPFCWHCGTKMGGVVDAAD